MIFTTNSPVETESVGAALGKILPAGTVIGIRLENGTVVSTFRASTNHLFAKFAEMDTDIVLLVATGEDAWLG